MTSAKSLEGPAGATITQTARTRRLKYAFVSGLISKSAAALIQLLALPLALKALGTDRYAAFLALQAFVAWAGLLAMGIVPSLPRFVSLAFVDGSAQAQRDIIRTALAFMAIVWAVVVVVFSILGVFVSPSKMIALHGIPPREIVWAYYTIVITNAFQIFGGIMPAIRGGYQELHYSYVWTFIASLIAATGLFVISHGTPTVSAFFIVLYGPSATMMIFDMGLLFLQRPFLLSGKVQFGEAALKLAPQALNALAGQFANFLVSFVPTLIVAHLLGSTATAAFGSVMQLLLLACSGMLLVIQPMVPALANAVAHQDWQWARRAYWRTIAIVEAICIAGILISVVAGSYLLRKWLGASLEIPPMLPVFMAIYFAVWMTSFTHFHILAATGNLRGVAVAYVIEGLLAVVLGLILTRALGVTGMALALVLATGCVTCWYLPSQVWRSVIRGKAGHS